MYHVYTYTKYKRSVVIMRNLSDKIKYFNKLISTGKSKLWNPIFVLQTLHVIIAEY